MCKGINRSIIGGREINGSVGLLRHPARPVVDGWASGHIPRLLSLLHGSRLLAMRLQRVGLRVRKAPGHTHMAAIAGGNREGVVASGKTLHLLRVRSGEGTTNGRGQTRSETGRRRLRRGGVEAAGKVRREGGGRHRKRHGARCTDQTHGWLALLLQGLHTA
ncbi:hypothetical protein PENTCL1PPCAC_15893, partial [Pristionchus entomophagus]